jgi:hypothetical protein
MSRYKDCRIPVAERLKPANNKRQGSDQRQDHPARPLFGGFGKNWRKILRGGVL